MNKARSIYDYYPRIRGTDCGRVLEETRRKYALAPDESGTNGLILITNLLLRFTQAIEALNIENLSIDRSKFEGLKVLDIGCGHEGARTNEYLDRLPRSARELCKPWLPRILAILGAKPTGVDLYYPHYKTVTKKGRTKEIPCVDDEWQFVQRDILTPGTFDQETFPEGTYDVVHCRSVITIDPLEMVHNDPAIMRRAVDDPIGHINTWMQLDADMHRLLREKGLCLINKEKLMKHGSSFIKLADLDFMTNVALDQARLR